MRVRKIVFFAVFLAAFMLGSCENESTTDLESLYDNEQAVDLKKGHRPGNG